MAVCFTWDCLTMEKWYLRCNIAVDDSIVMVKWFPHVPGTNLLIKLIWTTCKILTTPGNNFIKK